MNLNSFLALVVLGFIFLGLNLEWLGWVFILLGFVTLIYQPTKSQTKKAWAQASAAEGSYPKGKMMAYTQSAATQFAETTSTWERTKYDMATSPHRLSGASKSVVDEFNELFK